MAKVRNGIIKFGPNPVTYDNEKSILTHVVQKQLITHLHTST